MATTREEARTKPKARPAGGYPVATSKQAMQRRHANDPKGELKPGATARPGSRANPAVTLAQKQAQRVQPGRAGSSRNMTGDPALRTRPRTLTS
jgi:hypothetical protein